MNLSKVASNLNISKLNYSYVAVCDESSTLDDAIAVTVWGILLVYGFVTNILTIIAIFRNQSLRSSTSYWLIFNLAICDTIMIAISLCHLLPAVALHEDYVKVYEYRNAFAIFFYNIFWYTGVLGLGAMAVNRFISIMFPVAYPRMFSRQNTMIVIGGLYFCGFLVALPAAFTCCLTVFNHKCFYTEFVYQSAAGHYGMVDLIINSVAVLIMILSYSCILFRVRKSRLHAQRHRTSAHVYMLAANGNSVQQAKAAQTIHSREMRLFIQFFAVSVIFTATFITWQVTFRVGVTSLWVFFVMTGLFFVNNATSPTVYIIFNPAIRGEIWHLLACLFPCCLRLLAVKRVTDSPNTGCQPNASLKVNESDPSNVQSKLLAPEVTVHYSSNENNQEANCIEE